MANSHLMLYFDSESLHEAAWVVVSKSGDVSEVVRGSLKQAAKQAQGHKVILLVHARDVLLSEVNLPAMNNQRLLRAVPFAMEENLAADLDSLHFAIGERYETGELGVAVCSKEQIRLWLAQLKTAGLHPDYLTSDVYGIPLTEEGWTLHLHDTSALAVAGLRIDEQAGMGIEVQNIAMMLRILLERLEPEHRPKTLSIVVHEQGRQTATTSLASLPDLQVNEDFDVDLSESANANSGDDNPFSYADDLTSNNQELPLLDADDVTLNVSADTILPARVDDSMDEALDPDELDTLSISDDTVPGISAANTEADEYYLDDSGVISSIQEVCGHMEVDCTVQMDSTDRLSYLAQNYVVQDAINVLQGEFSRKEQLEKLLKPWIPAAAIISIWLFLQLGLFIADYQRLSAKEQALRLQVVAIYKQAFPTAKNIVDPKRQMENAIKKLKRGQGSAGGFLTLLNKAGGVLRDTPTLKINNLRFKSNKLDIDMEIADLQSLDELKSRLLNVGSIEVEIVSASSKDGKVDSRIQIKSKG